MNRTAMVALALAAGCSSSTTTSGSATPTPTPSPTYSVDVRPADFTAAVTNPWFPLPPGRVLEYRGETEDGTVHELVTVAEETEVVDGVACRVVLDRLFVDGALHETTKDYYAQDTQGNVWYFGEHTAELEEDGSMVSTDGTFLSGVTGALPGIVMTAVPAVGDTHRQEYFVGFAEDFYAVEALATSVTTPYRAFTGAIRTREWTPLEKGVVSKKWYARGLGLVKELNTTGGKEELALFRVTDG